MEGLKQLVSKRQIAKPKNRFLHSANHLLADELCQTLRDPKHFGFYLKQTTRFPHDLLRKIAAEVLENPNVTTPGRLFAYLLKKQNEPVLPPTPPHDSANQQTAQ